MRWLFRIDILVCSVIKSRKMVLMTEASKENVLLCAFVTPCVYEQHKFVLWYNTLVWKGAASGAAAVKVKLQIFWVSSVIPGSAATDFTTDKPFSPQSVSRNIFLFILEESLGKVSWNFYRSGGRGGKWNGNPGLKERGLKGIKFII